MGVEAVAFNNACKVFISSFPVKAKLAEQTPACRGCGVFELF
jgi:hypothetical protein